MVRSLVMNALKRIFDRSFPLTLDPPSGPFLALIQLWTDSAKTKTGFVTDGAFHPGGDPHSGEVGIVLDLDSGRAVTLVSMLSGVQSRSVGFSVDLYDNLSATPLYTGTFTFEGGCSRFFDISELRPPPNPEIVVAATKARIVMSGDFTNCD
ncbi:MAG: hypothetical protein RL693_437 [Verrucomicrobiota bacterium]